MRIVVDAFGGDHAPLAPVLGARQAKDAYGVDITLVGKEEEIRACAAENGIDLTGLDIHPAADVFSMHTDPTELIKSGKNSSLAVACQLVADGQGDAVVSAGSTGALVVGGTFIVKRIKGVKRAALGTLIPGAEKPFFMMDIGANAECRPEMLVQFAVMSSVYCKNVLGQENPTVGLLNIGTEETKGTELQKEAYRLLQSAPVNFIGNVEARDVPSGACDIVIADGFTGNVALKLYEGVSMSMFGAIKKIFKKNALSKLAAAMVMGGLKELKGKSDYSVVGGAALLGVQKGIIKAHGSSNANAFQHAIRQALFFCENQVAEKIAENLKSK
ncbi:MAG: phosphate acyltransferase PlsX [Clostridia bacterium]|nr:phosphate acyltransferase PlsX [Clostridia bacterium]